MTKNLTLLILSAFTLFAEAQTPVVPSAQQYGKIDASDLEMKACDFEKDANAMVLFRTGDIYYDQAFNIVGKYHKRIKIFNDNAKDVANIRIEFDGGNRLETLSGIQAQTVNLVDGKIEITKLDKKLIYLQHVDKVRDVYVFTMPNVKAGSVIEYQYEWGTNAFYNFPNWYFQEKLPVRYSELTTEIPELFYFKAQTRTRVPFVKRASSTSSKTMGSGSTVTSYNCEKELKALANIPSLRDEPYMSSDVDNLQSIIFQLTSINLLDGVEHSFNDTWAKIGGTLADDEDFGGQLKRKLTNEDAIITKASAIKSLDEKIAYVFNEVRNTMKWNESDRWYTNDGTSKAWDNKSGNSAEINLIVYHLLKKSGVKAYPMIVSTRDNGKVNPFYPALYQFNRAVVYIPVDSTKKYILDATGKYNTYNEIPDNLLNSSGLYIDKEEKVFNILFLQRTAPVRQVVLINGEIKPTGKMSGTAQLSSFSYNRINAIKKYKTDGEKKYIDYLRENDNNLKISSVKFDAMEIDTLPLTQNINFDLDLTGSDENYIYFNPNLFTRLHTNIFLSEERSSDIDFGYPDSYSINGIYKLPAGYKIDAQPKNVSMSMPDKGITFRRVVAEQDGSLVIRYIIQFNKSIYFKENYGDFHDFFKKMHEMLNEQIVLKKSS